MPKVIDGERGGDCSLSLKIYLKNYLVIPLQHQHSQLFRQCSSTSEWFSGWKGGLKEVQLKTTKPDAPLPVQTLRRASKESKGNQNGWFFTQNGCFFTQNRCFFPPRSWAAPWLCRRFVGSELWKKNPSLKLVQKCRVGGTLVCCCAHTHSHEAAQVLHLHVRVPWHNP